MLLATVAGLLLAPAVASASVENYTLQAGPIAVEGYGVEQGFALAPSPPVNGSITNMDVEIVDADGSPVPIQRMMLHHIVFLNLARRDATCETFTFWDGTSKFTGFERFYAAGEERAKMALPPGYGYKINPNQPWGVNYMVMNHRNVPDTAYIQYKVTVDTDPALVRADPYWLDAENCQADPIYNVPGNGKGDATHTASADFTLPQGGRILGGFGHVHGGAYELSLTQPGCGNRELGESLPTWGQPEHPFYNVLPKLHEPGPIGMSGFASQAGIPIAPGETVRLNSIYDNTLPHVRVMGIMVIYVAHEGAASEPCAPLPDDLQSIPTGLDGRTGAPPVFKIPLTGIDKNGNAVTIKAPPGKLRQVKSGATLLVGDRFFTKPNIVVPRGAELNWRFSGTELHNLTLANGPIGIGSDNLNQGRIFTEDLTKAGTYRFFCALHPTEMSQRVIVKGKRKQGK